MPIPVEISDGAIKAQITKSGELVTAPLAFDETKYNAMNVDNTAFNFALPIAGKQFIMTGFVAVSDKSPTADAIVTIYEAAAIDTVTELKVLIKFAMTKNSVIAPTPLRVIVNNGVWVNAKTDDSTIHLTLFGYLINKL